ncbi:MAG: hypothetical protein H6673_15305 [Anaerolineales bacterium]|nr:hypothetical protein [Anaerolineales bacterium]
MGFRRNKGDDDKKSSKPASAKADDKPTGGRTPFGGRGGNDKPSEDSSAGRRSPFARSGGSDDTPADDKTGGSGRNLFGRGRDSKPPVASSTPDAGSRSPFSRTSANPSPTGNDPGGRTFGASGRSPSGGSGDDPGGRTFGSGGRSPSGGAGDDPGGRTFGSSGGPAGGGGRSPFARSTSDSDSDTGAGGRTGSFTSSRPSSGGSTPFGGPPRTADADKDTGDTGRAPFGRSPSAPSSPSGGGGSPNSSFSSSRPPASGSTPFGGPSRTTSTDKDTGDTGRAPFGRSPSTPSPPSGGGSQGSSFSGGRQQPASGSTPFGGSSPSGGRQASSPASSSKPSSFGRSTTSSSPSGGTSSSFGRSPTGVTGTPAGGSRSAPPTGRTPFGADASKKDDKKDGKKGREKAAKEPKEQKERRGFLPFGRGGDKADKATPKKDDRKKDDRAATPARRSEPAKAVKATQRAAPLPKVENLPRNVTSPITLDRKLDLLGGGLIAIAAILAFGWLQTQFATSEARGFMAEVDSYAAQLFGIGRFVWIIVFGYVGGWLILRHFGKMFDVDYFRLMGYLLTYLAFVTTLQWLDLFFIGKFVSGFPEVQFFPDKEALKTASDALWQQGSGGGVVGHVLYIWFHRQLGDWVFEAFLFFWWGLGIFFAFDLSFEKIAAGMIARRHARQAQRAIERVETPVTAPTLAAAAPIAAEATGGRKKKAAEVAGKRTAAPSNAPITADTDGDAPQRQDQGKRGRRSAEPVVSSDSTPKRQGLFGRGGRREAPVEVAAGAAAALAVATEAPTQEQNAPQRRGFMGRGGRSQAPETPAADAAPSRDLSGRTGRRLDEPTQVGITATGEQPALSTTGSEAPSGRRPITLKSDDAQPATETDQGKRGGLFGRSGRSAAPDATTASTPTTEPDKAEGLVVAASAAAAAIEGEQGKRGGLLGRSGRSATPDAETSTPPATTETDQSKRGGLFGRSGRSATPDAETSTPPATTETDQSKRGGLFGRSGRSATPDAETSTPPAKTADDKASDGVGQRRDGQETDKSSIAGAGLAIGAAALASSALGGQTDEDTGSAGRRSMFGRGGATSTDSGASNTPTESNDGDSTAALPGRRPIEGAASASAFGQRPASGTTGRQAFPPSESPAAQEQQVQAKPDREAFMPRRTAFDIPAVKAPAEDETPLASTEVKAEEPTPVSEAPAARRTPFEFAGRKPTAPSEEAVAPDSTPAARPTPDAGPARRTPFEFAGRKPVTDEATSAEGSTATGEPKGENGPATEKPAAQRPMFDFGERKAPAGDLTPSPEAVKSEDQTPARRTPFEFTGRPAPTPVGEEGKGNGEKAAASLETPAAHPTMRPMDAGDDDTGDDDQAAAAARRASGERRSVFGNPTPSTESPAAATGLFTRRTENDTDSGIFRRREPTDAAPPMDLPGRAGGSAESSTEAAPTAPEEAPPTLEPAKPRGMNFTSAPTEALGRRLPSKDQEPPAEDDLSATKDIIASEQTAPVTEAPAKAAVSDKSELGKTEKTETPAVVVPPIPAKTTESTPAKAEERTPTPKAAMPEKAPEAKATPPVSKAPDGAKAAASEPAPTGPARWQPPDFRELLQEGSNQDIDQAYLLEQARIIEDTLDSFGAPGRVVEVNTGPVITQFGVEPNYIEKRGGSRSRVKVAAIASLDKDLALALAAKSIRIEAPVPGKGYVGIEVPNSEAALVSLRDVMDSEQHDKHVTKSKLTIGLGKRVDGGAVSADLTQMPHLLIAGATGSGKSICVNAVIACLLLQNTPAELQFIMVDPKRVELAGYNGIPHLVAPVVVDLERIVGVLKWVQREMDDRYKRFASAGARHIIDYNSKLPAGADKMPYLVVIIDELADLMMLAPDETERLIARLAQMARATGIHLIISTQRPSVDVVTGLIKANFPARIAFAVASSVDSRVILDQPGAEKLLGRGDMLYQAPDSPAPLRMQGVYVSDPELNRVTHYWKSTAALSRGGTRPITKLSVPETPPLPKIVSRSERVLGDSSSGMGARPSARQPDFWQQVKEAEKDDDEDMPTGEDELYDEAVELVAQRRKASISMLQRHFRIGYTRAARLIDIMEEHGVVGPAESGAKPREVLIDSNGKEIDYDDDEDDE